jgi:hypothetical protein
VTSVFVVSGFPTTTNSGEPHPFTVTAEDAFGNVATGYTGTVVFTSNDPLAVLPGPSKLTNGVGTFTATLVTPGGNRTLTATDSANSSLTGSQTGITVVQVAASFRVTGFPMITEAGAPHTFSVTAVDANGNVATGYTGTVMFTSNDLQAVLPGPSTLTNGVGTFTVTLKTAGTDRITVTDTLLSSLTGSETGIQVNPAATSRFLVSGFPSPTVAGVAHHVTVTAQDAYGNTTPAFNGRVLFASNDPQAVLPGNARLTNGTGTFAATLKTVGTDRYLRVFDRATLTITGAQTGIIVTPAAARRLVVSGFPLTTQAGVAHSFTVTARDAYGNVATGYAGTVAFTSDDRLASLPTAAPLSQGVGTFTATLRTVGGNHFLRATDTATPSIRGSETGITVTVPPSLRRGLAAPLGATAADGSGITGSEDVIRMQPDDTQAGLPIDYALMLQGNDKQTTDRTIMMRGEASRTFEDTLFERDLDGFAQVGSDSLTAPALS